jgi:hypothetical protein
MMHFTEKQYDEATHAEKKAMVDRELQSVLWELAMLEAGLCVRRAGLIWRLPLCHDSYGEGW